MSKKDDNDGLDYIPDYEELVEQHFEQSNSEDAAIEKSIKDLEQ